MSLFSAPFEAFYNKDLYRKASQSSLGQGFLYLLYFSGLVTVLVMLVISTVFLPQANRFMGWVKVNMPVLEIMPGRGAAMNVSSPYAMTHPEYGNVALFDMTQTEIPLEEIKDWRVVVTSTNAYFQKENGQIQVYHLKKTGATQSGGENQTVIFDAAFVQKMENVVKPILLAIMIFVIFVFFFVWKLLAALFYSLIGLSLNMSRRERLSYPQILNMTFLAITPAAWLELLSSWRGFQLPFGFLWSLALTGAYLYFGIRKTEEEPFSSDFPPSA